MSNDLLNILGNNNKDIDNQRLMDYLSGKLSAEEAHEVEKLMIDNEFVIDAMEGLETIENKKEISTYVEQINRDLKNRVEKKQARRQKRRIREYPWTYVALITLLALVCLVYYFLRKYYGIQ
jgi:anti-sigma factor RsiW